MNKHHPQPQATREAMTTLTIVLPLPNRDCHAHTTKSGWKKIKATKSDRTLGYICALRALNGQPPPRFTRASVLYKFWFKCNRGQDLMNFGQMCKAQLDGIVDAGIATDDNHTVLRPVTLDLGGYDQANPRVEITISSLDNTG